MQTGTPLVRALGGLLVLAALCTGPLPAWALSGNAQIALAGTGKFDELAAGVEAMVGKEPLKTGDWHALCYAYSRIKRYGKIMECLDQLDRAVAGRDKSTRLFGLDDATAASYLMRAEAQIELGEYPQAILLADKALLWYQSEKSDDQDIYVNALAAKALSALALGQRAQAQALANNLDKFSASRDFAGARSLAFARVNMALGHWQKVLDALAEDRLLGLRSFLDNLASGAFLRGVNNWVWIELPRGFMQTKALMELGRIEEARVGYDQLLAIPQVTANGEIHWMALFDRGRIAEQQNQPELAERLYQQAAVAIERQRMSINSEANKIGFVGNKQSVYARLVATQFSLGRFPQAFESMERGKSRALVDMLASRPSHALVAPNQVNAALVTQVLERMREADLDSRRQEVRSIQAALQPASSPSSRALASELPGALASLVTVSQLDVKEAQALLGADEAMIVYFGEGKTLFATLLQPGSVHGVEIDASQLDDRIRRLRNDLQQSQPSALAQLQALHQLLIAPLVPHIKASRLSIVPHGALHYLPFAALNDGSRDLIDLYNLRTLPSVSVLKYLRPSTSKSIERMLVFGNPDLNNELLDLPGAQLEAEALGRQFKAQHLLLRKQASRSAFQQLAPLASYIHVASHGEFDAGKPLNSGLSLAPDTPGGSMDAGRLTVADLYRLRLDAELITLSACETGLGTVASGDDVVGLTRGFLYAGTSTVIASLWKVDDSATSYLMLRMYEHMNQQGRRGALRQAQIETRKKYPHPFYWASFYLTGLD